MFMRIPRPTRLKAQLTTLVTIAVLALAGLASNALAADIGPAISASQSGWVGPYKIQYASCFSDYNWIKVAAPFMAGVDATTYLDRQQVGWQALLYNVSGPSPQLVRSTPFDYAWTTDQDYWGANFPNEYRYFSALPAGKYMVVYHLMWYASSWVANGGMAMVIPAMAYNPYSGICTIS